MAATAGQHPRAALDYVARAWSDDSRANVIVKASVPPIDTSTVWAIQSQSVLPLLSPASASARVLALGANLDLSGLNSLRIPWVSGRLTKPVFVQEGSPFAHINMATAGAILGPTKSLKLGCELTIELQNASADTATEILSSALAMSVSQGMDAQFFSASAASASAPAGLLAGKAAITPGANMTADLAALLDARWKRRRKPR
jgi:hypothetical protein